MGSNSDESDTDSLIAESELSLLMSFGTKYSVDSEKYKTKTSEAGLSTCPICQLDIESKDGNKVTLLRESFPSSGVYVLKDGRMLTSYMEIASALNAAMKNEVFGRIKENPSGRFKDLLATVIYSKDEKPDAVYRSWLKKQPTDKECAKYLSDTLGRYGLEPNVEYLPKLADSIVEMGLKISGLG